MGHVPTPIDVKRRTVQRPDPRWGATLGGHLGRWFRSLKPAGGGGHGAWEVVRDIRAREENLAWFLGIALGTGVALGWMLGGRRRMEP